MTMCLITSAGDISLVMLIYDKPEAFADEVQRDKLATVIQEARRKVPQCSLVILVVGLTNHWLARVEQAQYKQNLATFSR